MNVEAESKLKLQNLPFLSKNLSQNELEPKDRSGASFVKYSAFNDNESFSGKNGITPVGVFFLIFIVE